MLITGMLISFPSNRTVLQHNCVGLHLGATHNVHTVLHRVVRHTMFLAAERQMIDKIFLLHPSVNSVRQTLSKHLGRLGRFRFLYLRFPRGALWRVVMIGGVVIIIIIFIVVVILNLSSPNISERYDYVCCACM